MDSISPELVSKLDLLREGCGFPLVVNSGCRCEKRNKEEGGVSDSDHLQKSDGFCHGIDIRCADNFQRYKILKEALSLGFNRIGIAKSFIHLGDWKDNPKERVWVY